MARRRARRWWRWPLYGLAALLVLVLALVAVLQTGWAREQARNQVNAALAPLFHGKIRIDRIGGLGLWGVSGVDARIFDPDGRQVIRAQGLDARASLPGLAKQLLFGGPDLHLTIDRVRIDYADVTLREDEELGVTLASTFEPVEASEPAAPDEPEGTVELHIPEIELARVWGHGKVAGSPALDADLLDLRAGLRQGQTGFTLELREAQLVTRALPGASEPRGKLWGSIDVPAEPEWPLRLEGFLDGRAAGSPLWLEATWVGDDLYAQLRLPRVPADYVNAQAPGLALQGELSLLAEAQGTLPELELWADVRGEAGHVALSGQAFLSGGLEAVLSLSASELDLAGVVPDAPASHLSAQLDALVLEDEGEMRLAHRLDVGAGWLADVPTPPVALGGQLRLLDDGALHASGTWQVAEPGAHLGGRYRSRLAGSARDFVAVSLAGTLADPPRVAALGLTTAGTVDGEAELWLDGELLEARLDLSLRRLQYQAGPSTPLLQTRAVELRTTLRGSLDDPRAHAAVTVDLLSGRAHADLDYSRRAQEASVFLADIDLHRVAALLGQRLPFEQGNLNADFVARRAGDGNQPVEVDGKLRADFGKVGQLELRATSLKVPSQPGSHAALMKLSGELTAQGKLDLAQASRLSEMLGFPLERTTGTVRFELAGKRMEGGAPELALLLDTHGLRIVERREPRSEISTTAEAVQNAPFALEGIDGHVALRFAPHTGEAVATVITRDRRGTLAIAEAEAALGRDWLERVQQPRALLATPLRARVELPERRLQTLPALVRPPGLNGRIALDAELAGNLLEPRARGWVLLQRLRTQRNNDPIELRANFRYSPEGGDLFTRASGSRGEDLARLTARWQGDMLAKLTGERSGEALVASADTELFGLPLEVLPVLAEQQLKGRLVGRARLRDWGKDASLEARFEGRDIRVGTSSLPALLLAADCRGQQLSAEVAMKTGRGSAKASLEAAASWGARPVPALERRGVVKLSAHQLELATFSPLLGAYLSELSGLLDADAQVAVDAEQTRVSGSARLERGVVQVPAIGQRFSDIEAQVAVGDNQFELRQLTARGSTGRLRATGSASLDGFALRSAELRASIAEKEALPLTIEGAALGDAWGNLKVTYLSPPTGERRLDVNVPEFHLVTPDTGGSSLQDLDAADEIRIGTRRADGTFVSLPVQPLEPTAEAAAGAEAPAQPLRIRVILGNNVTVARGATAQAQLTGQLVVLSARETNVTGRIEIRGGKLDVQGKTFEIERGVITFDGKDPANPTITATARWDAPEHTVYAEYVGDVETGRIKLRAEPPLTQDQIASLLLFGDPDGSRGGSDPDAAALAVSVAGETAAKGLNKALSDFTSLDVRARVDTTTGSARPELALQVSPRVAAKVTRAIGEPAVGESPDRTFLTLELRLRRGWALSALLGDHGASALDLIWRHRY